MHLFRKSFLLFLGLTSLSIFNPTYLFPSLLPENVVRIGKEKYEFVGNLKEGQIIASLDEEKGPNHFCQTHISNIEKIKNIQIKPFY